MGLRKVEKIPVPDISPTNIGIIISAKISAATVVNVFHSSFII